jgi:predicted nucleic acid-binding protein
MQSPSQLSPGAAPIFLDTSVLINLIAASSIEEMGLVLVRPIWVESFVTSELRRDPRDGSEASGLLKQLVANGALQMSSLNEKQMEHFLRLVGAPSPDDLGDGEAATIVCSLEHGFAAIDERKALRIVARDYPKLSVFTTLDLLCSAQAFQHWGEEEVRRRVISALQIGRMRVPHPWKAWVQQLTGSSV